jgi:hypothetical protein
LVSTDMDHTTSRSVVVKDKCQVLQLPPVMCDLSVLGGHDETALIQVLRHLFIQFLTKLRSFVSSQTS